LTRVETLARLKERMRSGELVLGMQHSSGSAAVVELLGLTGWDFTIVDTEHASLTIAQVEELIRAAESVRLPAFVRVIRNDEKLIMQVLDAGAVGVLVPHVVDAASCLDAVAGARYPPAGTRGKSASSRVAGWGSGDWAAYERWAQAEPLVIPIVEDPEAVERIEEIVAVPGLELVALGPGDLSAAYGEAALGIRSPRVSVALDRLVAACRPRGIAVMTIPTPEMDAALVAELHGRGATVSWYGGDLNHVARLFRTLREDALGAGVT
jgi:2-keto-3-deoxy-L-rhamnonate aldolase RhmA